MAEDLTAALAALSEGAGYTTRRDAVLSDPPALPAIPARTGSALPTSGISGAGGGIASPLTETAFTDRNHCAACQPYGCLAMPRYLS